MQFVDKKATICNKENWTSKCRRERSFGFCQIHEHYHPEIVKNPRFKEWKWQIDKCLELYKGGTAFYGKANNYYSKTKFIK